MEHPTVRGSYTAWYRVEIFVDCEGGITGRDEDREVEADIDQH